MRGNVRRWHREAEAVENGIVTGFVPPIPTPFWQGALDRESLEREVAALAPFVHGYLVGGSVGEYPNLTVAERIEALRLVAAARDPRRHTLVAGVGDNVLSTAQELARAAEAAGADLLIASCPNYYANDRAMLAAYFAAIAGVTQVPLCLYDNPLASHTTLSVEDIMALAEAVPRLTHVKVTDPSAAKVAALRARTGLVVHGGEDTVLWHQLSRGAQGGMVALPLYYPRVAQALWAAIRAADWAAAAAAYRPASHFIHIALGAPDYVAVLKTVLHARGVIRSPEVRLPLLPLAAQRRAEVLAALDPGEAIGSV
jgi:4-hydroxy-tetrahydrodipicolinate synthase